MTALEGLVYMIAESYGVDEFFDALEKQTEFPHATYDIVVKLDGNDKTIAFEPPLHKDHHLALCQVVMQEIDEFSEETETNN